MHAPARGAGTASPVRHDRMPLRRLGVSSAVPALHVPCSPHVESRTYGVRPDPPRSSRGFSLSEVEVRLARPDERHLLDALMDEHQYFGLSPVGEPRPVLRRDLRGPVAGPCGVAERRLQVRAAIPVGRLETGAAVPAA